MRTMVEGILVDGGVDPERARRLARDPRLETDPAFILKNLSIAPPRASAKTPGVMAYDPVYIEKGLAFMEENREYLASLKERYGTSPEILTALLIIESRLGTYPMRYHVMCVLANMAPARDQAFVESLKAVRPDLAALVEDEATLKAALSKGGWASRELPELIALADELQMDPFQIMGSISGALGPAQFIPSTFRKYGVDGDGDGRKDPFAMKDALASMASYIRSSGWREDADEPRIRKALWHYNHSEVYVSTVLKIYRELVSASAERMPRSAD